MSGKLRVRRKGEKVMYRGGKPALCKYCGKQKYYWELDPELKALFGIHSRRMDCKDRCHRKKHFPNEI